MSWGGEVPVMGGGGRVPVVHRGRGREQGQGSLDRQAHMTENTTFSQLRWREIINRYFQNADVYYLWNE